MLGQGHVGVALDPRAGAEHGRQQVARGRGRGRHHHRGGAPAPPSQHQLLLLLLLLWRDGGVCPLRLLGLAVQAAAGVAGAALVPRHHEPRGRGQARVPQLLAAVAAVVGKWLD